MLIAVGSVAATALVILLARASTASWEKTRERGVLRREVIAPGGGSGW